MSTIIEFKDVSKEYVSGNHILKAMDNVAEGFVKQNPLERKNEIIAQDEFWNSIGSLIDNEEATLKILKKQGDTINLIPCNKNYQTRTFAANRVKVQGVLSGIVRNYK